VHKIEVWDDILIVRLKGDIDMAVTESLRADIDGALLKNGCRHLLLDMSEVEFMDSSGLGLILGRYKRVASSGRRLFIVRPRARVKQLMEMAGVTDLIPIYTSQRQVINR